MLNATCVTLHRTNPPEVFGTSENIVGKYTDPTSQKERNALCPTAAAAVNAVCASTAVRMYVQLDSDISCI